MEKLEKIKCGVCFQPYCFNTRSIHFKSKKHLKVFYMMDEYTKIIIDVLEHRGKKPQEKSLVNINDNRGV